jgi:hypothetical protein
VAGAWTGVLLWTDFVFPSLYEGFGIPVLEAMGLETPVVCSDLPALLELTGDAALFFDPSDEARIAQSILRLWTEDETRDRLVRKGRTRAAAYAGSMWPAHTTSCSTRCAPKNSIASVRKSAISRSGEMG